MSQVFEIGLRRGPGPTRAKGAWWPVGLALVLAFSLWACDSDHTREVTPPVATESTTPDASGLGPSAPTANAEGPNTLPLPPPGSPDASYGDVGAGPSMPPAAGDASSGPTMGDSQLLRTEPETVTETLIRRILEERRQPLPIEHLISRGEVRQVTGYLNGLAPAVLEGRAPDETYNALRFATEGSFGFGLQVWSFPDAERATTQFDRMRDTYIVTGSTRVGGDSAFRAELGGIRQLVFMSRNDASVVALSCDVTVCAEESLIQELAQRVHQRL